MTSASTNMFEISPLTGQIIWGNYVLSIDLTLDKFTQRYPQLEPQSVDRYFGLEGIEIRVYQLPALKLKGIPISLQLFFSNQYINLIAVGKGEFTQNEPEEHSQKSLLWLVTARELLRERLGTLYRTSEANLLDEADYLSKSYLDQLENWHYVFEWGQVDFTHECQFWDDLISIKYDQFQQIKNWDELIEEWSRQVAILRANTENIPAGFLDVPAIIAFLRPHFAYQSVRPKINHLTGGLVFGPNKQDPRSQSWFVGLDIDPNRSAGMYKITRTDTTRRDYANRDTLVEILRVFIESENLA